MAWKLTRHEEDPTSGRAPAGPEGWAAAAEESDPAAANAQVSEVEDEQLAASLSDRAQDSYQTGHYAEAEALFIRALEIRERVLGPEHVDLLEPLTRLAAAHAARGQLGLEEPLLQRALAISEAYLGSQHPDTAICLQNLAQVYLRQNEVTKAEPLLLRLLDLKRAQGDDHPGVATALASLAATRTALGNYDDAEQLLRWALRIRERALTPNHFVTAVTLEHLADACAAQGKLGEALALLERALEMREQSLSATHPSLAATRAKIADLQLLASQEMSDSSLPQPFVAPRHRKRGKLQPSLPREVVPPASSRSAGTPEPEPPRPIEWQLPHEVKAEGSSLRGAVKGARTITGDASRP